MVKKNLAQIQSSSICFLRNNRSENHQELVETMIKDFKYMDSRMSLEVHKLHVHLEKFKNNMGHTQNKKNLFHKLIMDFERQINENMMGDYTG